MEDKWILALETEDKNYIQSGNLRQIINILSDPSMDIEDCQIAYGKTIPLRTVLEQSLQAGLLDVIEDEDAIESIKHICKVKEGVKGSIQQTIELNQEVHGAPAGGNTEDPVSSVKQEENVAGD